MTINKTFNGWFVNFLGLRKWESTCLKVFVLLFFFCSSQSILAQSSVLSKGEWYKVAITQGGVHKIDANFLKKAGIDITKNKSSKYQVVWKWGGVLPQANQILRLNDLVENAIEVVGEADGKFDNSDYVIFYGESPHTIVYDTTQLKFRHQNNYYSDSTFYFLTISDTKGLRIGNAALVSSTKVINSFDDCVYYETEQKNLISSGAKELSGSGREWYGEYFGINTEQSFEKKIEGIVSNSEIKITSAVVGVAYGRTQFNLKLNNQVLGAQLFDPIWAGRYDTKGVYDEKGKESIKTFVGVADGNSTVKLTYTYDKNGQSSASGYLNYFEIEAKRKLQFYEQQTLVRSIESLKNTSSTFVIAQANAQNKVWEVTNAQIPASISYTLTGTEGSFGIVTAGLLKNFVLFSEKNLLTPYTIEKVANQNLHAVQVPDLLIVTLPDWRAQAERLAEFRRTRDGLSVVVATTNEVYNEFGSGKPDITAIRDFSRFLWLKDAVKFKYLLLFGDATYDYKNLNQFSYVNSRLYIPTYESRESLNPILSFSSDDYLGFLEEKEGEWVEDKTGNHSLDIGVGRLPVKTTEEAKNVVDKLMYYAQNQKTVGRWRGKISFVADDGDGNVHQEDADNIATLLEGKDKNLAINKIYVDNYSQVSTASGTIAPDANKALNRAVNEGALIVNYSGHGGPDGWTEEKILTVGQIESWRNLNNMPIFLTATCSFGRFDDPSVVSGAEIAMLSPKGAAIGLLTTTRPVYSYTNYLLNTSFYTAFASQKDNKALRLGDIFKETKNKSLIGVNNRNFSLLGDPSMRLAYPMDKISITKINNQKPETQTLKALSKVVIEGEVQATASGARKTDFNGQVIVSVFDKPSKVSTLGQKESKFNYQIYQNKLFEGKVEVKNGLFSVNFVVPKDINYQTGQGKIECYAILADSSSDAIGSFDKILIGGSEVVGVTDTQAPKIELLVDKNNILEAKISDESGINVSQAGIGHEMILTLNDTLQVVVNQYFTSENGYTSGVLTYAFGKLPEGRYTVKLKIWDTYNNSSEVSLEFVVENEKFRISKAYNYPNPFQETTSFSIEHNGDDEDIVFDIEVFDQSGKKVLEKSESCYSCLKLIDIGMNIEFQSLVKGTYYYRISATLLSGGTKTSASGKLVFWK